MNFFAPITTILEVVTSFLLLVMNPGIIYSDKKSKDNEKKYCHSCKFLYPSSNKGMEHCYFCNICICKMDHHCGVIEKCVGKYNLIIFFLFVINFIPFMICICCFLSSLFSVMNKKE
jgi:palmitoyltransferase